MDNPEVINQILALEERLAENEIVLEKAKTEYETLRQEIFALMDIAFGENTKARVFSEVTAKAICRELTPKESYTVIDELALETNLTKQQWRKVTDTIRVLNQDKLAKMVESGVVAKAIVDLVTERKQPTQRLRYRDGTKQEREMWEVRERRRQMESSQTA